MRNREALQTLLARARARVDPAELGLAPRADPRGRKVDGLTHEHMTQLLGWPEHKYGYVERGKLATIGTEVLAPIARILHLSDHEWEALVLYATGLPPEFRLDPQLGTAVPRPWERVLAATGEMAYVNDVAWDLVAYNSAFTRMFRRREVPDNTMRWMLLHPEARITLAQWETAWLPLLVPQVRAAVAANPHNRTLARMQADAKRDPLVAPHFDSPTAEYIQPRADGARPLLHAELGLGWVTMCGAGPFGVPGGRLMFVLFDQGERPEPTPPLYAPASGPVDPPQDGPPGQAHGDPGNRAQDGPADPPHAGPAHLGRTAGPAGPAAPFPPHHDEAS